MVTMIATHLFIYVVPDYKMQNKRPQLPDTVDIHVDHSGTNRVDAHSRYPLLDGLRKYTVKLTSLVSPLTEDSVPTHGADGEPMDVWFQVRRRRVGAVPNHATTLLSTYAALNMPAANETFTRDSRRAVSNLGDLVFYLNEYFTFIHQRYVTLGNIVGARHGGHADLVFDAASAKLCTVLLTPTGHLRFIFSPVFCKNYYIVVSDYAQALFGLSGIIAFRRIAADPLAGPPVLEQNFTGTEALYDPAVLPNIILTSGDIIDTVDHRSSFPADRHLEHRVRIEVESQMPVQNTVVWNADNVQQLTTVIAAFPIRREMKTTIALNNAGIVESGIQYEVPLLNGNIVFRESNNLVTQKYMLQSAQQFHNIRLELFMVRKEWKTLQKKFVVRRRKMVFGENQNFSAKLRFESV
jgi:hypothetical protein